MREIILPVASKGHHPYEAYYAKKPYRVEGNRGIRRLVRSKLWRWALEGNHFQALLAGKKDGWDCWDIL